MDRLCLTQSRRLGIFAFSEFFWLLVFITSFLILLVDSTVKNSGGGHQHSMNKADLEDDEFAEFEEFDEEIGGGAGPGSAGPGASPQADKKYAPHSKQPPSNKDDADDADFRNPADFSKAKSADVDQNRQQTHKNENEPRKSGADFEKEPISSKKQQQMPVYEDNDDLEGVVEEEIEDEFSHLKDEAEFENFDREKISKTAGDKSGTTQQLKITDVPAHLRNNWSNFQVELLMIFGLIVYLANYAYGKSKNHRLATSWFEIHREILQNNFEIVGDDGTTQEIQQNILMKESDHVYSIWCSGRQGCQGCLIQMKFLKRQDIISLIMQLFKPKEDKVVIRFNLNPDDMDAYVFAFGSKKSVPKIAKEMTDLSQFCTEKKNVDKLGLPEDFCVFAEIGEATNAVLDPKTIGIIRKHEELIDYIHVSDQYCGTKANEGETQSKLPETSRVAIFSFNLSGKMNASEKDVEDAKPLLTFALYCLDKIRRFRLSREAKQKCDKNRLAAQESYLKQTHAQRQEAAQIRREEKARERKERLLAEEDPEKQKRLEKVEQKRELKKKQPKVKQLKIKAG